MDDLEKSPPALPGRQPFDDEKKPFLEEIAVAWKNYFEPSFNGLLQPRDETLLRRGGGRGIWIYDELERDGHVYGLLQKRKMALIGREWRIVAASKSKQDRMAADIVDEQLMQLPTNTIFFNLLDAILKGYAVSEVMWEASDTVRVASIIARDQRRFAFDVSHQLRLLTLRQPLYGEALPARKFVVHTFGAKDANPYGLGLGTRLFWPVFFKRQGLQFWLQFLDKYGSPTAVGSYPTGATQASRQTLLQALQAIAHEACVALPAGMDVKLLEAVRSGNAGYEQLLLYLDDEMSEVVLSQTATSKGKGGGLGSNAAGIDNDVRIELTAFDADLLADSLNNSLIRWIVEYNKPGAALPRIVFDVSGQKDRLAIAQADKLVFDMGFRPTIDYVTANYGEGWESRELPSDRSIPDSVDFGAEQIATPTLPAGADGQARMLAQAADPSMRAWMAAIRDVLEKAINEGTTLDELLDLIAQAYPDISITDLAEAMKAALSTVQLAGRHDLPNGLPPTDV